MLEELKSLSLEMLDLTGFNENLVLESKEDKPNLQSVGRSSKTAKRSNGQYEMQKKRWQNLIHRKCPGCDERMIWKGDYFRCPAGDFTIRGSKVIEILTDETHIIHQFMTQHERQVLEEGIRKLVAGVV